MSHGRELAGRHRAGDPAPPVPITSLPTGCSKLGEKIHRHVLLMDIPREGSGCRHMGNTGSGMGKEGRPCGSGFFGTMGCRISSPCLSFPLCQAKRSCFSQSPTDEKTRRKRSPNAQQRHRLQQKLAAASSLSQILVISLYEDKTKI